MDIHGISKYIPCIYHTYTIHMDEDTIWMVYTRHIPKIGVPDGKLSHSQHQHDCVVSSSIFFRGINIELCGGTCDIKINEIESRWQWCSPFSHVPIVCNFLISCCFISCSFLVVLYFMTNVPAPKRVLCALGIVCDAENIGENTVQLEHDLLCL